MLYFLEFFLPTQISQLSDQLILEQCTHHNYSYGHNIISIFNSLIAQQVSVLAEMATVVINLQSSWFRQFVIIKYIDFVIIHAITAPSTMHIQAWKCYGILFLKVPVESIQGYNIVCRLSIHNSYLYMRLKFLI